MGNCVHKQVTWLDDDDDDDDIVGGESWRQEKINLLHGKRNSKDDDDDYKAGRGGKERIMKVVAGDVSAAAATEIKIRISRKQLEELLRNADGSAAAALQKVVLDLVSLGEASGLQEHGRHYWRPNLQTIPE